MEVFKGIKNLFATVRNLKVAEVLGTSMICPCTIRPHTIQPSTIQPCTIQPVNNQALKQLCPQTIGPLDNPAFKQCGPVQFNTDLCDSLSLHGHTVTLVCYVPTLIILLTPYLYQ